MIIYWYPTRLEDSMMIHWFPAKLEVNYDDDDHDDDSYNRLWFWLCTLHSFLHMHLTSPVCIYVYQPGWDGCIDIGKKYALCYSMFIEPSESRVMGVHIGSVRYMVVQSSQLFALLLILLWSLLWLAYDRLSVDLVSRFEVCFRPLLSYDCIVMHDYIISIHVD